MGTEIKRGRKVGYQRPDPKGEAVKEITEWVRRRLRNPKITLSTLKMTTTRDLNVLLEAIRGGNGTN
jgi:hypothetical protein